MPGHGHVICGPMKGLEKTGGDRHTDKHLDITTYRQSQLIGSDRLGALHKKRKIITKFVKHSITKVFVDQLSIFLFH